MPKKCIRRDSQSLLSEYTWQRYRRFKGNEFKDAIFLKGICLTALAQRWNICEIFGLRAFCVSVFLFLFQSLLVRFLACEVWIFFRTVVSHLSPVLSDKNAEGLQAESWKRGIHWEWANVRDRWKWVRLCSDHQFFPCVLLFVHTSASLGSSCALLSLSLNLCASFLSL